MARKLQEIEGLQDFICDIWFISVICGKALYVKYASDASIRRSYLCVTSNIGCRGGFQARPPVATIESYGRGAHRDAPEMPPVWMPGFPETLSIKPSPTDTDKKRQEKIKSI